MTVFGMSRIWPRFPVIIVIAPLPWYSQRSAPGPAAPML
jgi:hypothetical protein